MGNMKTKKTTATTTNQAIDLKLRVNEYLNQRPEATAVGGETTQPNGKYCVADNTFQSIAGHNAKAAAITRHVTARKLKRSVIPTDPKAAGKYFVENFRNSHTTAEAGAAIEEVVFRDSAFKKLGG